MSAQAAGGEPARKLGAAVRAAVVAGRHAWRVARNADASAWPKLTNSTPLQMSRWLIAIGLVIGFWAANGNQGPATSWIPVGVLVLLLLLPDAASVGILGVTWQAKDAANRAEAASQTAERVATEITAGATAGSAAITADQSTSTGAPAQPAESVLAEFGE
jgi:hypothetical protein